MIFLQLFWSFFKIGSFTIGGGYAMVPIIEEELVRKRRWIESSEFVDMLALSQSAPGILAVNISIATGYRIRGIGGAITATLGTVLPSFIIILLIAMFFQRFQDNEVVERIFKGIRPAVVALIAAPLIRMGKSAGITVKTFWIPVAAALLVWLAGVSPVYIIIGAIILGIAWNLIKEKREFKR